MSDVVQENRKSPVLNAGSDSDNDPIWDRALAKRRRAAYVQPSAVSKIFPDLDTKTICQLCEMVESSPLEIQELLPDASTKQVCRFFDLVGLSAEAAVVPKPARREGSAMADPNLSLFEQLRELDRLR